MSNKENHIARRDFLKLAGVGGAGLLIGSTGVGGTFLASQYFTKDKTGVKNKINFYGKYQSGITTEQQKHIQSVDKVLDFAGIFLCACFPRACSQPVVFESCCSRRSQR